MLFDTDTIMGLVIDEVSSKPSNQSYIDEIDLLIIEIDLILDIELTTCNCEENGLIVGQTKKTVPQKYMFINVPEFNCLFVWLVEQLKMIYLPTKKTENRLFVTIGYLLETYHSKYDDIGKILKLTAMVSIIWLHPDHIRYDQFIVHPNKLPDFGIEF